MMTVMVMMGKRIRAGACCFLMCKCADTAEPFASRTFGSYVHMLFTVLMC